MRRIEDFERKREPRALMSINELCAYSLLKELKVRGCDITEP